MIPSDLYGPWDVEGYQVRIDCSDRVRLVASRDGKRLAALPTAVKQSDAMAWMKVTLEAAHERHRQLRSLLERAMTEDIPLTSQDVAMLALDPVGRPFLSRLLMEAGGAIGRPEPDEWLVETVEGDLVQFLPPARVLHPLDLVAAGTLERWDRWLNRQSFRQPLPQIRREWYRPNQDERDARGSSSRFAGAHVRWDQSRALLEGRGWHRVTKTGAEKRYPRADTVAYLEFRTPMRRGWSKEDVVVYRAYFLPRGETSQNAAHPGMPVEKVGPVVFSETMRDVALVAKVAAREEPE